MIKKKVLIATGGTGGHIFPAYSLANYLISKNFSVVLTTDKRGEKYLENYKNINYVRMPSSPLIKKNIIKIFFSIIINFFSLIKSLLFLLIDRPLVIFGTGGYASFPICIAAIILKIRFIIYENNMIIGKANKYLLPYAKKIFVSYKELEGIPEKYNDKVIEIGNLIREEIIDIRFNDQIKKFDRMKILVLGGSQAARVFAEELPKIFKKLKNLKIPIKVFQQCQENQNEELIKFYKSADIDCEVFNFTNKIIDYYSRANLVITRSGASALGELVNAKIPFISIPLPGSADNHQYKNAEFYLKKGYGYLVEEKDIKTELYSLISSIFKDTSLLKDIISNQRQYSDKNTFKNLNNFIEKILNEKN